MTKKQIDEQARIRKEITKLEAQRKAAIASISDDLSDDEWDETMEQIFAKYDVGALHFKMFAMQYKETRNDWFKGFVQSFGICESKRITRKQADIFVKYSEPSHELSSGRGANYFVRVGNWFIKTTIFCQNEPGYITIRELCN